MRTKRRCLSSTLAGKIDGDHPAAGSAQDLIAHAAGATVVVNDPTRVTVRGALLAALRDAVDLRCERPLRIVACTTSPLGRGVALSAELLVKAVAQATGLPAFDVVSDLAATPMPNGATP